MHNVNTSSVLLRQFTRGDLPLFKRWLNSSHVKTWYCEPDEWISEVEDAQGKFDWISHFIVEADGKPIALRNTILIGKAERSGTTP